MSSPIILPETCRLIDAQERASQSLHRFHVPTPLQISRVRRDSLVKIGIEYPMDEHGNSGERFWVQVYEILPNGCYIGRVENGLVCGHRHSVVQGDMIQFCKEHILATE